MVEYGRGETNFNICTAMTSNSISLLLSQPVWKTGMSPAIMEADDDILDDFRIVQ
jgi:hypothetical protein